MLSVPSGLSLSLVNFFNQSDFEVIKAMSRRCQGKGETADFVLPGFLGFLRYSWDFHEIPGISMIFIGFPGFQWDFRDYHGILGISMGFPGFSSYSKSISLLCTIP